MKTREKEERQKRERKKREGAGKKGEAGIYMLDITNLNTYIYL